MGNVESRSTTGPGQVVDLDDFINALAELRAQAGNPPYRSLARRVGTLLRPPREVPFRTVADIFKPGRRRLDLGLVIALVRALGADEPHVEAWRQACLRVQAETRTGGPIGVLRQLPAELPTFTGREEQLRRLIDAAGATNADLPMTVVISAIEGMGGVGKTQLALRAAHELVRRGRFGDVQFYANLHGFDPEHPPADPGAVLDTFLRQLEVPAQRIPASIEERAAMFRDRLNGKRALIVLDNAANESQVRDLIPGTPGCLVLLTSRRTLAGLDGATTHLLDVFNEPEAIELLGRIAGQERVTGEPGAAADVVRACGFLPLAVSLAAARLRTRPSWSLADLAERLHGDDVIAMRIGGRSLDSVFDLSYQDLPEPTRRAFRLLGLFPGRDFSVPAVAAVTGSSLAEAASVVEDLQDEHLLEQRTAGRYEFHDLVGSYARRCVLRDETSTDRAAAFERLLLWYAHSAENASAAIAPMADRAKLPPSSYRSTFGSPDDAMDWCRQELQNVIVCVEEAGRHGHPELAWRTAGSMWAYLRVTSMWDAALVCFTAGLKAAQEADDLKGQACMHNNLATRSVRLDQLDQALHHFQVSLEMNTALGDLKGQAISLNNIGSVHTELGEYEAALECLTRCQDLRSPFSNHGIVTLNIGKALGFMGRHDEAIRALKSAEASFLENGDHYLTASAYEATGRIHLRAGHTDRAEAALEQAIAIRRTIGNQSGTAAALLVLGDTYIRGHHAADAQQAWNQALSIYDDLEDQAGIEKTRQRLQSLTHKDSTGFGIR